MKKNISNFEKAFVGVTDPDLMFDLCIFGAFMCGQFNGKIPVDESRKIFDKIKKKIIKLNQK